MSEFTFETEVSSNGRHYKIVKYGGTFIAKIIDGAFTQEVWDAISSSYTARFLNRPTYVARRTREERALECLEAGMTGEQTADVLNREEYRTETGLLFDQKSVWNTFTYFSGQICLRSGLWRQTSKEHVQDKTALSRGEVFPQCLHCNSCKWSIAPSDHG